MNKIRVALVDDHAVLRKSLRMIIERQPDLIVVAEAADGLTAIEMVKAQKPDVVLIDVRLPRLDGLEATRIITSERPQTKVIVFSLLTDEDVRVKAKEAGAIHFLPKDSDIQKTLSIIRGTSLQITEHPVTFRLSGLPH